VSATGWRSAISQRWARFTLKLLRDGPYHLYDHRPAGVHHMTKGIDRKKETKKKPALNLMQKRAAKAEKKKNR
jgi:hypothetical protein